MNSCALPSGVYFMKNCCCSGAVTPPMLLLLVPVLVVAMLLVIAEVVSWVVLVTEGVSFNPDWEICSL
jgi:hypothetical protein